LSANTTFATFTGVAQSFFNPVELSVVAETSAMSTGKRQTVASSEVRARTHTAVMKVSFSRRSW